MTKFLNISVDNTLGGNSPSDVAVSSQKAVKEYVDAHSGGSVPVDDVTINRDSNQKLQAIGLINKNEVSGATSPIYDWVGTRAEWEDGSQSTWYCWENSSLMWSTQTLSYNTGWYKCAQSDTTLAFIDAADNRIAYTTDGDNWSYSSISSGSSYYGFVYGNGKFIACGNGSTNCKYSSDLSSWTSVTLPVSGNWNGGIYTGSMFLIPGGNNYITSADGTSWTARTFPNSLSVKNVAFGNGIFVAVASGNILTSTDGETWTVTAKTGLADSSMVLYGNGKFVIGTYDNTYDVYYSTDGLNWSTTTSADNKYWQSGCFGGGVFLLRSTGRLYNYSLDGIKWFSVSSNLSDATTIAYFANKFICPGYWSDTIEKSSFTSTSQYTLDATPTTSSDLYSAVETPSSLTITSVGTGYISLSDGYDYYYNSGGNQFTYRSIGDIHPDWLCCILEDSLKLGTTTIANNSNGGSSRNIGEIITSTIPLTDAGLHLLDGALISGAGSYSAFVTYISGLVTDYPGLFETEANWQQAVTDYGVCGKFVYDSVNNTVRLPKITGFTEGTVDLTALGDLIEAGLPDHMHTVSITYGTSDGAFAHVDSATNNSGTKIYDSSYASTYNPIYGNSMTVQPQAIKVLYYIVVANSTKTNIEVDIDEVMTDLNGKADVDLSNVNASGTSLASGWAMPSDRYTDLTLGASGTDYIAPANGYVLLQGHSTASGQQVRLYNRNQDNTTNLESTVCFATASGQYPAVILPVKKGNYFRVSYDTGGASKFFRLIYAEGDQ